MASTITVTELFRGVQDILQDRNPAFRRWPEADLVRYTNYGRMALATYLPQIGTRTDSVKLRSGCHQDFSRVLQADILPGDGSAAADTRGVALLRLLQNMGAAGATPGRAIHGPVDRAKKDALEPLWMTESGAEILEYVFDKNLPLQCWVSPGVTGSVWARLQWMALPTDLPAGGAPGAEKYVTAGSEAARVVGIPDQFVPDLQNYVIAVALMKGSKNYQNLPKAQVHAQLFVQSINAQAQAATGVNPNLTALPFVAEIASS